MRLRAIELTNIRRFAGQRASLTGIGDGITVLSAPNEFGKSTFFDALHALFFERHASRNAAIKALQPHAGGAPEVAVEIDLPEGRFRLAKRWLNRPQAQVLDGGGRLIAQADEAEAWIDRLMGGGLAGPSGLLWVRQGLLGLEPEGGSTDDKRTRERGLAARRDLLSSVAGEIDMMTGGRRMDAVLDRVADALARLSTATGRPKAGGEWARALDDAAALTAEETDLRPRAARLSGDLARRAEVQRSLAHLTDPADIAARARALAEAETAHETARAHSTQVEQAETALRLARLDAERLARDVADGETRAARLGQALTALAKAEHAATEARRRADDLTARDRAASEAADAVAARIRDLRDRLRHASRAQATQAAQAEADELHRRLDRATALRQAIDDARTRRSAIRVTAQGLEAADKAQGALDLARARVAAQAVTVHARPDGAAATIDGRSLPDGPTPILTATDIRLPGFGSLRIDPGSARGADMLAEVAQAEEALARLLEEAGAASPSEARAQWAAAQALDADAAQSNALLAELAPDGIDALRAALARAATGAAADPDGPDGPDEPEDPAALTAALTATEAEEQTARAAARAAQDLAAAAREARAAADANRTTAARHLAEAQSDAGDAAALAARIADLRGRQPALADACAQAESTLETLRASAPDMATVAARRARAQGAVDQAARDLAKAREDLASLDATIAALADEGIEERLSTIAEARAEAETRAARYETEVRSLTRLRRALDEARSRARDAYFGPVLHELQPLLAILHPGAQLTIDDTSLLPAVLTRDGQAEPLDILSGGTREQVAILTRLAFARLFAASGRPVPVILDDALVHSDDDRIEAMFDALHRTARDQQILVLTCRQRAFAALGGQRGEVVVQDT